MQVDEESSHISGPVRIVRDAQGLECSAALPRTTGKSAGRGLPKVFEAHAPSDARCVPISEPHRGLQPDAHDAPNFGGFDESIPGDRICTRLRLGVIGGACAVFRKSSSSWLGAASIQAAAILGLLLFTASSQAQLPANLYDYTRTDQFTYDPTTGFMLTHTVEPSVGALCSVQTFGYNATDNRNSVQTANCMATVSVPSNALFTTRSDSASFVAPATQNITVNGAVVVVTYPSGLVMTQQTNAATQSESQQIDPRFGELLAITGPNALTTNWSLDDFGRVVRVTAPDSTSAVAFFCMLPLNGIDTSSNSAGCPTPLSPEVPADAASFVQVEPHNSSDVKDGPFVRTYSDRLGRVIRTVTQSFDGASQPSGINGALVVQDTVYNAFGAVAYSTQPYFLSTLSSTTIGSGDLGVTAATYDVLGRTTQVISSDPDGNAGSRTFGSYGSRTAAVVTTLYSGYITTTINDKGQTGVEERNVAGELARTTDVTGAQLVRQTDAFGNLVATKDVLQNTISIAFDIRGDRTSVNDPDGGITLDCYDPLGELVAYQYANMRGGNAPGACLRNPNSFAVTPSGSGVSATKGGSIFVGVTSNTCTGSIAAGATCTIVFTASKPDCPADNFSLCAGQCWGSVGPDRV